MNTNLTPLIGDYVAGKLEGKVLAEFEARIASDAPFAALVNEARKKHEALSPILPAPKERPIWIPVAAGLVGIAMFAWLVVSLVRAMRAPDVAPTTEIVAAEPATTEADAMQTSAGQPVTEVSVPASEAVTNSDNTPAQQNSAKSVGRVVSTAGSSNAAKPVKVSAKIKSTEPASEVVGNYTPNPTLASKLDIVHDGEFRVKHSVTSRRDTVHITAEGAATFGSVPDPTFVYKVYSNRAAAFKQNKPIFQQAINFGTQTSEGYSFNVSKKLLLKPGLYYAVIEQGDNRKIVWSDEIEIEHFN